MNNSYSFSLYYEYDKNNNDPVIVLQTLASLINSVSILDRDLAQTIDSKSKSSVLLQQVSDGSIKLDLLNILIVPDEPVLSTPLSQDAIGRYISKSKIEIIKSISKNTSKPNIPMIDKLKTKINNIAKKEGITNSIAYSSIGSIALVKNINSFVDSTSNMLESEKVFLMEKSNNKKTTCKINKGNIIPIEPFLSQEINKSLTTTCRLIVKPKLIDFVGNQKWKVLYDTKSMDVKIQDLDWLNTIHSGERKVGANDIIEADFQIITHYNTMGDIIDTENTIIKVYE